VVSATLLFSLAHSPNIGLMALSFCFGLVACVLFLRNRNIFTLALMHGILSMVFTSFLVPGLVGDFRKGPWKGNAEFIASIDYNGSKVETNPSKTILIPISVINKSAAPWDSKDKDHPVFVSYHLFNAKGDMMEYDNIRTSFNKRIGTDESVRVDLRVNAPSKTGEYYLEVDIVKDMDSKIINRALLIIMGCLIFALSPLLNDVFLVMLEYIVGTSMVFIGSISMVFLLKKYRKNKKITNEDKIDGRRIL